MVVAVAAIVAAAATVGGVALSAGKGGQQLNTTSQLEFPEETRRLIGDIEFPQLASAIGEQTSLLGSGILGGGAPSPFAQQQYGARPLAAAQAGLKRGAQDAGVTDLGTGTEALGGISPQLIQAIRTLALQNAAQRTSVVPAGYTPFLSPSTFTSTSTNASPFETGFALAGGAANIAGGFFGSSGGAG